MRKVIILIMICSLMMIATSGANTQDYLTRELTGILGVDIRDGTVIRQDDTHGGFHGDGHRFISLSFAQDNSIESKIEASEKWRKFPLTKNLNKALYGLETDKVLASSLAVDENDNNLFPKIKNGYYFFLDRHSESRDSKDDSDLFERYSRNFTIAIYDTDNCVLYYYELDT